MEESKQLVKNFWNDASCGENLYLKGESQEEQFNNQLRSRYELEPYIIPFASFAEAKGKKVLEIGVGLGADHQMFAQNGAILHGCDLTERAIQHTRQRLELFKLRSELREADAENLPYPNNEFDMVYSWGVIHHSPDTQKAANEIHRVLKSGGKAKVMIYNKRSMIGLMLWIRYGLMKFKPFASLSYIYSHYLESPGTKAYTVKEAKKLFHRFKRVTIQTVLTHGDLLSSNAGQRHQGFLLSVGRKIFPRFIIKKLFPRNGLFMLIELEK
jgi:ubiquinone/menaquinone biosynthesis C-methylase UbiE